MKIARSHVPSTSPSTWEDRSTVAPRRTLGPHQFHEAALHEQVEPTCRLIEQQHIGRSHESRHDAELLLRPLRHRANAGRGIELEELRQLVAPTMIARAAHRRHEIEERPAGKVGGTGQLARR